MAATGLPDEGEGVATGARGLIEETSAFGRRFRKGTDDLALGAIAALAFVVATLVQSLISKHANVNVDLWLATLCIGCIILCSSVFALVYFVPGALAWFKTRGHERRIGAQLRESLPALDPADREALGRCLRPPLVRRNAWILVFGLLFVAGCLFTIVWVHALLAGVAGRGWHLARATATLFFPLLIVGELWRREAFLQALHDEVAPAPPG